MSIACKPKPVGLKQRAVEYFRVNAEQYAERYTIAAHGDVLWQRHQAIVGLVAGLGLRSGSRLLDLGCGPGRLSLDLASQGYRGVGVDAAAAMIGRAKIEAATRGISELWQYQVADVEKLPLRDGSFDCAICAGVVDYLPTDDKLLQEAHRVLRPGGVFILAVTNKYGYTVSLSSLADRIKRWPLLVHLASAVRHRVIGGRHGVMSFDFAPRKHRPSDVRVAMASHDFRIEADKYLLFTVLPAPFCTLFSRLALFGKGTMNALDRTPLRVLGSCYLIVVRKPC
jgi:ubiquinone/menaquinone biosynthesis C-methylase UbiE